jgi:mono/diheme cytochrome c family protein
MRIAAGVLLSAAILIMALAPGRAEPVAGQKTFTGQNCTSCHYTEGPAREKTIDDQLAKKGPELFYAGSKFQRDWLESWLQNPQPIRPLAFNSLTEENSANHPKLAVADATNVVDFLMTLTSDAVVAGVITPKRNPKGRQIFIKKMPCSGCHQYTARKKITGGRSGPSLVDAGSRLNPDWIYAYLKTPDVFKPVKAMPTFVGLLREKDMKNVAAFVANFKAK